MRKEQLIDLVSKRFPKEHPEVIAKHIHLAMNYLIKEVTYVEAERKGDFGLLDDYIVTYIVKVQEDKDREERYCDLPVGVVPLPKNRGVRFVSDKKNQSVQYLYRDNNTADIYGDLDVDKVVSLPRWYKEGKRIYLSEHLSESIEKVLVKLIPDFESLPYDSEVSVPAGFGRIIFDLVSQSLQGRDFTKMSNDNNPNTI